MKFILILILFFFNAPLFAEAPIIEDTDRDSLSNAYEIEHGLDPNDPRDAILDKDNDGFSNIIEKQYHSSPTDPFEIPPLILKLKLLKVEQSNLPFFFHEILKVQNLKKDKWIIKGKALKDKKWIEQNYLVGDQLPNAYTIIDILNEKNEILLKGSDKKEYRLSLSTKAQKDFRATAHFFYQVKKIKKFMRIKEGDEFTLIHPYKMKQEYLFEEFYKDEIIIVDELNGEYIFKKHQR